MPMTTYRSNKATFITDDKDINEWLPENYYVERIEIKRLFKKPFYLYRLLYDLDWEYQIINFWGEGKNSIHYLINKEVLMAFLAGLKGLIEEKK